MRIVVLNNAAPFVRGGAELLADKLVVELERAGHEAELVRLPFDWTSPDGVVDSMLSVASLKITNCDRVIALKFPVYLVQHEDVVVWLLHQFRQVYDLWNEPTGWPDEPRYREVRQLVHTADQAALKRASARYCISPVVRERLSTHLGLDAEVLLHPLPDDKPFTSGPYGDYLLALGRVSSGKRQHLAVAAMEHLDPGRGRLVVAGSPDTPEDAQRLLALVRQRGLEDRVEIIDGFITEGRKRELLAGARGVVYLPVDEDSYGYVTLEAAEAARPVVTLRDSGGILILVEDDVTGLVVEPEERALASAFSRLFDNPTVAARLGAGLHNRAQDLRLDWGHVVSRLVS